MEPSQEPAIVRQGVIATPAVPARRPVAAAPIPALAVFAPRAVPAPFAEPVAAFTAVTEPLPASAAADPVVNKTAITLVLVLSVRTAPLLAGRQETAGRIARTLILVIVIQSLETGSFAAILSLTIPAAGIAKTKQIGATTGSTYRPAISVLFMDCLSRLEAGLAILIWLPAPE